MTNSNNNTTSEENKDNVNLINEETSVSTLENKLLKNKIKIISKNDI